MYNLESKFLEVQDEVLGVITPKFTERLIDLGFCGPQLKELEEYVDYDLRTDYDEDISYEDNISNFIARINNRSEEFGPCDCLIENIMPYNKIFTYDDMPFSVEQEAMDIIKTQDLYNISSAVLMAYERVINDAYYVVIWDIDMNEIEQCIKDSEQVYDEIYVPKTTSMGM